VPSDRNSIASAPEITEEDEVSKSSLRTARRDTFGLRDSIKIGNVRQLLGLFRNGRNDMRMAMTERVDRNA